MSQRHGLQISEQFIRRMCVSELAPAESSVIEQLMLLIDFMTHDPPHKNEDLGIDKVLRRNTRKLVEVVAILIYYSL